LGQVGVPIHIVASGLLRAISSAPSRKAPVPPGVWIPTGRSAPAPKATFASNSTKRMSPSAPR
jgi:hypothetical protein